MFRSARTPTRRGHVVEAAGLGALASLLTLTASCRPGKPASEPASSQRAVAESTPSPALDPDPSAQRVTCSMVPLRAIENGQPAAAWTLRVSGPRPEAAELAALLGNAVVGLPSVACPGCGHEELEALARSTFAGADDALRSDVLGSVIELRRTMPCGDGAMVSWTDEVLMSDTVAPHGAEFLCAELEARAGACDEGETPVDSTWWCASSAPGRMGPALERLAACPCDSGLPALAATLAVHASVQVSGSSLAPARECMVRRSDGSIVSVDALLDEVRKLPRDGRSYRLWAAATTDAWQVLGWP